MENARIFQKFLHFPPDKPQNTIRPGRGDWQIAYESAKQRRHHEKAHKHGSGSHCRLHIVAYRHHLRLLFACFQSQVGDPKFAAAVTQTMISISDPPPGKFTYKGAADMMFTKVVILAKEEHFIILVQARQAHPAHSPHSLKQAIANGSDYGPLSGKSFEGESEGEMPVGNGTMEYQLGNFTASGGQGDFKGMLGLLKNAQGEPRVLIESFDRTRPFDFDSTKKFLQGIRKVN